MSELPKNGTLSFERIIYSIFTTLIAAGVIGLWTLSVNVGKLETRVALWSETFEKRFMDQEARIEKRFDALESDQKALRRHLKVPPP